MKTPILLSSLQIVPRRLFPTTLILLFTSIYMHGQVTENVEKPMVLLAKAMIDVESGTTIRNPAIYIRNGKIETIGDGLKIPDGLEIIDVSNKYIIPGLVDAHTHLCHEYRRDLDIVPGSNTIAETVLRNEGDRALLGAKNAREMLMAGFTTVRDLGNSGMGAAISLRNAINKGWAVGPRMFASTRALSPIGGQFVTMAYEAQSAIIPKEYVAINGIEDTRKAVRQAIYDGADCIKVIVNNNSLVLSQEELNMIVGEANRAGLKVAAHATHGDDPSMLAVKSGVNSIEHGYTISKEVLDVMANQGTYLVPTDRIGVRRYQQRIQRALQAGVKIAFGSDMYYHHNELTRGQLAVRTYQSYKEAGMTNLQILQSATMHPGNLVSGKEKIGLIQSGYFADIIALDENPLENIKALENVVFVMKEGQIVKNDTD